MMIQNGGIYANVAIQLGYIAILECMHTLVENGILKEHTKCTTWI